MVVRKEAEGGKAAMAQLSSGPEPSANGGANNLAKLPKELQDLMDRHVAGLLHIQSKPTQDNDPAGLGADLGASSLPRPGAAGDLSTHLTSGLGRRRWARSCSRRCRGSRSCTPWRKWPWHIWRG